MALALIFGFLGGTLGWMIGGVSGAAWGALLAGAIGGLLAAASRRASDSMPRYGVRRDARALSAPAAHATSYTDPAAIPARLSAIEERLARLERALGIAPPVGAPAGLGEVVGEEAGEKPVPAPLPPPSSASALSHGAAPSAGIAPAAPAANRAWAWFTGGNTLTRIGVVVLFFGVAFLLRWFAEHFALPVALRLAGVALGGLALLGIGLSLARSRPAYGLALQGAGAGILYLTTFAALRLFEVLAPAPAFALLLVVAAASVWLALRSDSQAFAALALAGGFLAPVLVSPGGSEPLPLFGYLALLNGALFAIAWRRAWRALNALGFVFTFALALVWGFEFYSPHHFAVVEPFLALFFAFYLVIAILEAARRDLRLGHPVDALLTFGVPAAAFALQHGLVRGFERGDAWSAVSLAAIYGALALALRSRPGPGLALLARAFIFLAFVFGSLAIAFAVDPRHTAAWWALEAAGAYWLGCRQRQAAVRGLALLLQVGAAMFLLHAGPWPGERLPFANAGFVGAALIGIAALASAFAADRNRDALHAPERTLVAWLFAWGTLWWIGAGWAELRDRIPAATQTHAVLAWIAGSAIAARLLQSALRWPRVAWAGAALLPAMAWAAAVDYDRDGTTLLHSGYVAWPFAWIAHWATLAGIARSLPDGPTRAGTAPGGPLEWAHALSAVLLVAYLGWEAGEWTGRYTPEGTSWITASSAIPPILYLGAVAWARRCRVWPFSQHRDAYAVSAGTVLAALLAAWFVLACAISPGDPDPLPYLPIANPLDVSLGVAIAVAAFWATRCTTLGQRVRYAAFGLALFVMLNGMVVRTVHHWDGVPWRIADLAASRTLQAALTLTWTATALPLMFVATRRSIRPLWMVGAALLALVVVKLFAADLAALSGLPRVVAFLGVGALLLVIGYVAPLPPASRLPDGTGTDADREHGSAPEIGREPDAGNPGA